MQWIEKHLNWTYGIALIVALIAFLCFLFTSTSMSYIGWVVYIVIIWVGGYLIAWRKSNWSIQKPPLLILVPPVFAIVALCSHNNRRNKVKGKTNNKKELSIGGRNNDQKETKR
jgi:hypothetical protein